MEFYHVITQFDHRYAAEDDGIPSSLVERAPYTTLGIELVNQLYPLKE
jgi:hypothetical protein